MKVAIIGTGVMGRGWITQFAMQGHAVHCFDANAEALEGVVAHCEKFSGKVAKRWKLDDPEIGAKTAANIEVITNKAAFIKAAQDCEIFLEVVYEDLKLKCEMLAEYMPQLPKKTKVWSNSSSLDVAVMGRASGDPARFIVTHGMNPVPMVEGVEVVPGEQTSADTVEFTRNALLELKKIPFLAPNIPGFWVNRLLVPQMLDAYRLLEQGKITVGDGDAGLNTSLGHPQGTFKLSDFVSAPTMLRVSLEMYQATLDPRMYPPAIIARMIKNGDLGAICGKGFYDWSDPRNPKARDLSEYRIATAADYLDALK